MVFMTNLSIEAHERAELERMVRSQRIGNALAQRARTVLALADGQTYQQIIDRLGCSPAYIALWKTRFETERLSGMVSRYAGQPPRLLTPKLEAKILEATRRAPKDGSTHW